MRIAGPYDMAEISGFPIARVDVGLTRELWRWTKVQFRRYRDVAPLAALAYAWWRRKSDERDLMQGRFMEQCTFLMVNVDGLRRDGSLDVGVPTLFTRSLREITFNNPQMAKLISEAAKHTTMENPFLPLGTQDWLVMANINAHILEVCGAFGHTAALCGHPVEIVEVLFALVNDVTTTSRHQLRVYLVREDQLRNLPPSFELDLRRGSRKNAYAILQKMAASYRPPNGILQNDRHLADAGVTSGLAGSMGRTWLVFPRSGYAQSLAPRFVQLGSTEPRSAL